jgi:hypothetical protein
MKSVELRKVVMRATDDGISSVTIAQQLRQVVSSRTVRRWQDAYRRTGKIDLKNPPGRPRIVRTKHLVQKVKNRLAYKRRRSARKMGESLGVSKGTMSRIIKDDLHLHAYRITTEPNLNDAKKIRRTKFAYWVRRWLRKKDCEKILFSDEKYFSINGIFNRQNDRIYAANRQEADEHGGTKPTVKFSKKIMIWLGASKNGLTAPIIFEPGETLKNENYIKVVLPHALSEGRRLLGDDFIYQQDGATPHTHKDSQAWCASSFPRFIDSDTWPPNSPDLNVLDYYVWDAIGNNMHWEKVNNYDSLKDEIAKGIARVSKNSLARSVESWSLRILSILKTKGAYIK